MRFQRFIMGVLTAFAAMHASVVTADTVDIRGSTTVNGVLVTPFQPEIEALSGHKLKITPSNSGLGLTELIGMNADIAMISAPFKNLADRVGKTLNHRGPPIDERNFKVVHLGYAEVLFIVHPHNKVRRLSRAQLQGLLSGSITNWRDVGGTDQPVVLVSSDTMGAIRTEISRTLLGGKDITHRARVVERAPDAPKLVATTAGALGFVSSAMPASQRQGVTVVPHEGKIKQTLFIVTRQGASAAVEKVVEAIKAVAAQALQR